MKPLKPDVLCLADRLSPGHDLWGKAAATGAHLLWRAETGLALRRITTFSDGSWPGGWKSSVRTVKTAHAPRVVEDRIAGEPEGEIHRLLTTLLDPEEASAVELAELYPERGR